MIHEGPLGRNYPKHFEHVAKFALADDATPAVQPVASGFNWYENFDSPVQGKDGKWRIGQGQWKSIRGGHCICACPPSLLVRDTQAYWVFYNQGEQGACEGFGHSRRFTILTGKTYNAFHLYEDAQRIEGTYEADGGSQDAGTTNDAICQALKKWGVHTMEGAHAEDLHGVPLDPNPKAVSAYHWAVNADQILKVLGITDGGEIPFLNSWGEDYPKEVWIAPEGMERLMREGGECDVLLDR